jgi:hypothetical protein
MGKDLRYLGFLLVYFVMVIYYFEDVCSTHYFKCECVEAEACDTLRERASVLRVKADKVSLLCGF